MAHYEDLNTTKIALIGFISSVLVFALILFLIVMYHLEFAEENQLKVVDQPATEFDSLVADQRGKMASYRWIDPEKKIVQIPIKQAMALVVEELQKSPVSPPQDKPGKQQDPAEKRPETKTPAEQTQTDKAASEDAPQETPSVDIPETKEGKNGS